MALVIRNNNRQKNTHNNYSEPLQERTKEFNCKKKTDKIFPYTQIAFTDDTLFFF